MLTENYILDALQAEREGEQFPIDFDVVWESFGYNHKHHARRYLTTRSGLERFTDKTCTRLGVTYNQSAESDKILLSVDSYKFALARANTDVGKDYLIHLIAIEKQYIANLERSLFLSFDTKSEEPAFPYSSTQIHEWVDYCNRTYTRSVIKNDYEEGIDYIWVKREMYLSADAATILLNAARPRPGVIIPSELKKRPFPWDKLQQFQDNKINRRRSQSHLQSEALGQLSLFN
jgi:hypothetical protein